MSCSPHLTRGGNISLFGQAQSEQLPELTGVFFGLGWSADKFGNEEFDLDATAIGVDANGRAVGDDFCVFYNNLVSPCGAITHMGDNRTGAGAGDDELIRVSFGSLDPRVEKVVFAVSIHEAERRGQDFGRVSDAYIRVMAAGLDGKPGQVLTRYDLTNEASGLTATVFGEMYRGSQVIWGKKEWKFRAIGQGYRDGLAGIARDYGLDAS